jgi:hypothetical protein
MWCEQEWRDKQKNIIHAGRNKCKDKIIPREKELVVDKVNPKIFKYQ